MSEGNEAADNYSGEQVTRMMFPALLHRNLPHSGLTLSFSHGCACLLSSQISPATTNDGFSNLWGRLALFHHLLCKEDLLDANESTSPVIGGIAVKQASMAEFVTVAVAGLLGRHPGDFSGCFISACHKRITEIACGK